MRRELGPARSSAVRRGRALFGLACILAIALAALTARLFVWPPTDEPGRVDAVVVLSGDHGERMAEARRLLAAGVAPVLVHAGSPDSADVVRLCAGGQDFEVVCLQPSPDSTKAEARAVAGLAADRGWRSIAVVTSTQHLTRAVTLFRRCVAAEVRGVAAWPSYAPRFWAEAIIHEWGGLLHAVLWSRAC